MTYVWDSATDPKSAVSDLRFAGYREEQHRSSYGFMNDLVLNSNEPDRRLEAAKQFVNFTLTEDDHEILRHVEETIHQALVPQGITEIERQFMISEAISRVVEGENARAVAEVTADWMRDLRE